MPQSTIQTKQVSVRVPPQTYDELDRLALLNKTTLSATIHSLALDKLTEMSRAKGEIYIPAPFRFFQDFGLVPHFLSQVFTFTYPGLGRVTLMRREAETLANQLRGPEHCRSGDYETLTVIDGQKLKVQRRGHVVWLDLGDRGSTTFSAALAASVGERMLEVIAAAKT